MILTARMHVSTLTHSQRDQQAWDRIPYIAHLKEWCVTIKIQTHSENQFFIGQSSTEPISLYYILKRNHTFWFSLLVLDLCNVFLPKKPHILFCWNIIPHTFQGLVTFPSVKFTNKYRTFKRNFKRRSSESNLFFSI